MAHNHLYRTAALIVTALSSLFANPAAAQFADVDLRGNTMCAITTDGVGLCADRPEIVTPDNLPRVIDIAAGQNAACVVTENGDLQCWGSDGYGITEPPTAGAPYSSVSTDLSHACAINRDSSIECWGLSNNDRLEAPEGSFQQLSVAQRQACALDFNGTVFCWGLNELGTTNVPTDLPPAQKVQAGTAASCALLLDGGIQCWGLDMFIPQNGPYVDFSANSGATVDGSNASGGICGLDINGSIDCEFTNLTRGALTSPEYDDEPTDDGHIDISVGPRGGCTVNGDGDIQCFGSVLANIPSVGGGTNTVPSTTGLTAAVYSATTAELMWDSPTSPWLVAGHEIQRDGEVVAFTQNQSSYMIDDLVPGQTTEFAVRQVAYNDDTGDFSDPVQITTNESGVVPPDSGGYTPPARPYEPTGLDAFVYGQNTVEVVWDRISGSVVSGYEIRRDGEFILFTNGTSFIDEVPGDGGIFRYDVIPISRDDPSQFLGFSSISVGLGGAEPGVCL